MDDDRAGGYAPHEIELLQFSGVAARFHGVGLGVIAAGLQGAGHVDDARRLRELADELSRMAARLNLNVERAISDLADRVRQGMDREEGSGSG